MTDPVLDKLVANGDIASYTYDDGGKRENLTIVFPSGQRFSIQPTGKDSLMFWDE